MDLEKHKDIGLLCLRIGLGTMFILHGAPKMFGGPEAWESVGMAMATFGIKFAPVFWGFCAAFAEFIGGILIILGLFFRVACLLIAITMSVATSMLISKNSGFIGSAQPIEDGIVFLCLILIGPGKFSLDEKLKDFTCCKK